MFTMDAPLFMVTVPTVGAKVTSEFIVKAPDTEKFAVG